MQPALSPVVVPGNICTRMHNGLMFLAKLPRSPELLLLMIWMVPCSSKDASAGNVGGH